MVSPSLQKVTEDKIVGQGNTTPMVARSIFALYACNAVLVDGTDISLEVVDIGG